MATVNMYFMKFGLWLLRYASGQTYGLLAIIDVNHRVGRGRGDEFPIICLEWRTPMQIITLILSCFKIVNTILLTLQCSNAVISLSALSF